MANPTGDVTPAKAAELLHALAGSVRHAVELAQGGSTSWARAEYAMSKLLDAAARLSAVVNEQRQLEVK